MSERDAVLPAGSQTRPRLASTVVVLISCLAVALALIPHGSGALPSGRPPAPGKFGKIGFTGAFADGRVGGAIQLGLSGDGRRITDVTAYAPGPCNDRDFGRLTPGENGATGVVFSFFPKGGAVIRPDGSFSISGSAYQQPGSRISVKGMFAGDTVRGRVKARSKRPYDTCTANVAFTARRDFG